MTYLVQDLEKMMALPEVLKSRLTDFMPNRANDIIKLKQALNENDKTTISSITHNLAGLCPCYGLDYFGVLAQELNKFYKASEMAKARLVLDKMQTYLDQICDAYPT